MRRAKTKTIEAQWNHWVPYFYRFAFIIPIMELLVQNEYISTTRRIGTGQKDGGGR